MYYSYLQGFKLHYDHIISIKNKAAQSWPVLLGYHPSMYTKENMCNTQKPIFTLTYNTLKDSDKNYINKVSP